MTKQLIHIKDMHCPACVIRLESLEDDMPGITCARASLRKQTLEVDFDEAVIPIEQVLNAVRDLGYQVDIHHT
jgi:copper chaperone CopZ